MKETIEQIIKHNTPEEATQKILKLVVKSDVIGSYKNGVEWFWKLSPYHREKVRERYNLKSPTLKITDEMLNDIYKKELELNKWERVGDLY